jgi:glutamate---cysteine ligase / carboxylate-amine ligase
MKAARMITVGVEEEFLLLFPNGAVAPVAPGVLRATAGTAGIKAEFMTFQVETTSGVCTDLTDLAGQLIQLRVRVAEAAEHVGARLVASASPPFGDGGLAMLTDTARYRELAARFPAAAARTGTCACQVHVGMADRELGVQVLGRLRPWLPVLLAITANSPFLDGRDTGWSSIRYRRQVSWPTFRPPASWPSVESYDRAVSALLQRGVAFDQGSVYLLARLSPRFPTLEVRLADTCLHVQDAVLLAAVVRGLVAALVDDVRRGRPAVPTSGTALRAQLLAVALRGTPTAMVGPRLASGERSIEPLLAALLQKIRPALEANGDLDEVLTGLERLVRVGTGARQQRRLRAGRSHEAFVAALARAAVDAPVQAPAA